ncbi:MAG TPA: hypothetical protein VFS04_08000 [Alphaproteobacteria bacterium]|nr:hypothetical protein [Alphaproteobacteria bacterium]
MTQKTGEELIAADMAVNVESLSAFIGPRAQTYVRHWQNTTAGARKFYSGIVWQVLLVPVPWLLYRKMYLAAAVVFFLPIAFELLFPGNKVFGIPFAVAIAISAKDYYLYHAKTKIKKIAARYPDTEQQREKIARTGGVSWPAAIIGVVVMAVQVSFAISAIMQKTH